MQQQSPITLTITLDAANGAVNVNGPDDIALICRMLGKALHGLGEYEQKKALTAGLQVVRGTLPRAPDGGNGF